MLCQPSTLKSRLAILDTDPTYEPIGANLRLAKLPCSE